MADLNDSQSALTVKIVGSDSSGTETNFIDATANGVKVDGSAVTQPVSAASLPLPSGASTSALQTTGNSSLSSIDTKTPPLGQTTMASSTPVTIASNQSDLDVVLKDSAGNELASFDLDNTGGTAKVLGVTLRQLSNGTPVEVGSLANPMRIDPTGTTNQPVLLKDGVGNLLESSTTVPSDSARGLIVRTINEEPATFSVWALNETLGNNKHMLSVMNGIGSGVVVKLKKIKIINSRTAAATGVVTDFRGLRITSLTGGTTLTPQAYDTNDTISGSVTAASGGTVGGLGTVALIRALYSSDEWGPGGQDVESTDHINQTLFELYNEGFNQKPITIRAGQGFTIQCVTNTTAGTFDLEFVFTQEVP